MDENFDYQKISAILRDALEPIQHIIDKRLDAHEKKIDDHANESRAGFREQAANTAAISARLDVIHSRVDKVEQDNQNQYHMITGIKDKNRDIEISYNGLLSSVKQLMASVENNQLLAQDIHKALTGHKSEGEASKADTRKDFWESTNGKIALSTLFILVVGLLTLAGVQLPWTEILK